MGRSFPHTVRSVHISFSTISFLLRAEELIRFAAVHESGFDVVDGARSRRRIAVR
jgi:hypothetical protein